MRTRSRITSVAAVVLSVFVVSAPLFALPPRGGGEGDRDLPPLVRIIKKISKAFGIKTLEDFPSPPKP